MWFSGLGVEVLFHNQEDTQAPSIECFSIPKGLRVLMDVLYIVDPQDNVCWFQGGVRA
jgi:hypothetical protein